MKVTKVRAEPKTLGIADIIRYPLCYHHAVWV